MISGNIKIDDELTIHYQESGNGNTVILMLPGWTMSTKVYEHQLNYFESSDEYRFITLDPRSHGLSSKTEGGHFYEQHGRDLHYFIEALKLDRLILGGWSFGTLAILSYVHQYGTAKLAGLIMLDGPPRVAGPADGLNWITYTYDDKDGSQEFFTLGKLRDRNATNKEFASWMLEDASDDNIQWVVDITNQTPDTAAALLNATSIFLDYTVELVSLDGNMPLFYCICEENGAFVKQWAEKNTPTARVFISGKHLMFWERAETFNRELIVFLKNNRPN